MTTTTTLDNPQVGDIVQNYDGEIGIISLVESDKFMCPYYVHWITGYLTGFTTAHKLRNIRAWSINVRLNT